MTPDTRALAQTLLLNYNVPDTVALINRSLTSEVTYSEVDSVRRALAVTRTDLPKRLIAGERAGPTLHPDTPGVLDRADYERKRYAKHGCDMLRDATRTYYERRGSEIGCDWADAGVRILAGVS